MQLLSICRTRTLEVACSTLEHYISVLSFGLLKLSGLICCWRSLLNLFLLCSSFLSALPCSSGYTASKIRNKPCTMMSSLQCTTDLYFIGNLPVGNSSLGNLTMVSLYLGKFTLRNPILSDCTLGNYAFAKKSLSHPFHVIHIHLYFIQEFLQIMQWLNTFLIVVVLFGT